MIMVRLSKPAWRRYSATGLAVCFLLNSLVLASLSGEAAANSAWSVTPEVGRYYVVQQAYLGQPEFIFEIAQRFLRSGGRFREIISLNQGRLEPGGKQFTDPTKIQPGWVLALPDDASGQGVVIGVIPTFGRPASTVTKPRSTADPSAVSTARSTPVSTREATRTVTSPHSASPIGPTAATAIAAALASQPSESAAAGGTTGSGSGGAAANSRIWISCLAALAVLALVTAWWFTRKGKRFRWIGRQQAAFTTRAALPIDASAAWTVDRSLRAVATECRRRKSELPGLYVVTVSADDMVLRLSSPNLSAPAPWVVEEAGRTWRASLRDLQQATLDNDIADPYDQLVTLGLTHSGRMFLDLSGASGSIALEGGYDDQVAVADAWARELAANPWSRAVRIIRVGFAAPGPAGAFNSDDLSAILTGLDRDTSTVLLLAHPPVGSEEEQVRKLVATPGGVVTVIILGGAREARWRFTIRPDGRLETGFITDIVQTSIQPVEHGR